MSAFASRKTARAAARNRGLRLAVAAPRLVGEQRIVLPGIDWKTYLRIDQAFGDDNRPGTRLNYLHGELEIMTTSSDHERIKTIIGHCLEHYCVERDIWFTAQGQMTRQIRKDRAAEADESYSFDRETHQVGLVVEVSISSGGISKLALYEELGHPEVWLWRRGKIEIHAWADGEYRRTGRSTILPSINVKLVEELTHRKDDFEALREFRRRLAAEHRDS